MTRAEAVEYVVRRLLAVTTRDDEYEAAQEALDSLLGLQAELQLAAQIDQMSRPRSRVSL